MKNILKILVGISVLLCVVFMCSILVLRGFSPVIVGTKTNTPKTPYSQPTKTEYVWSTPTQPVHTPTPFSTYTPTLPPEYLKVDLRDFVTYPEKYEGQFVEITARISNVTDSKNLQLEVYEKGTFAWIDVYTVNVFDGLYPDDKITVQGVAGEKYCSISFEFWDAVVCDAVIVK